jgi:CHAT domain-containing protein
VLVVADPVGRLPGARDEAEAVCAALGGRADVVVTRLDGDAARIAAVRGELERGRHDVFHFAGQANFDDRDPKRSGLGLTDGVLVAGDLIV